MLWPILNPRKEKGGLPRWGLTPTTALQKVPIVNTVRDSARCKKLFGYSRAGLPLAIKCWRK